MAEGLIAGAGLLCLLVVAVTIPLVIAVRRRERRRTDRLRAWARENGWIVTPKPVVHWRARLPGGNRGVVTIAVSGAVSGRPVSVAEYAVSDVQITSAPDGLGGTTTSTTTTTHHYTVAVAALSRPMPYVAMERRGKVSRLARVVLGPGETATGNADFDRAFRIRTADPAAVRRWCTPSLIDAHLRWQIPDWSVTGTEVLTYRGGRLDPASLPGEAGRIAFLAAELDRGGT
jgi:hypothetical protein